MLKRNLIFTATILLASVPVSLPLFSREGTLDEFLGKRLPVKKKQAAPRTADDEGENPSGENRKSPESDDNNGKTNNGEKPGLYEIPGGRKDGERGRRRTDDSNKPSWKVLRIHFIDAVKTPGHSFASIRMFYDYFSGNRSMVRLSFGYIPKDLETDTRTTGFSFGLLYGIVAARSHFRDGAAAFSWDIGGFVKTADLDDTDGFTHITGKFEDYQARLGIRGDFYAGRSGGKSVMDMWLSTYVHLIAGQRKYERFSDGTPTLQKDDSGIGIAWGFIFTSHLLSVETEFGYYQDFFLRAGVGIAFSL